MAFVCFLIAAVFAFVDGFDGHIGSLNLLPLAVAFVALGLAAGGFVAIYDRVKR